MKIQTLSKILFLSISLSFFSCGDDEVEAPEMLPT